MFLRDTCPYLDSSYIELGASGIADDEYVSLAECFATFSPCILQSRFITPRFNLWPFELTWSSGTSESLRGIVYCMFRIFETAKLW